MKAGVERAGVAGERRVGEDEIATFARLTGDDSRIHLDSDYARENGLPGIIAHGLLTASWALGALAQNDPERLGMDGSGAWVSKFSARFTRMVVAGDSVSFRWRDGASTSASDAARQKSTSIEILNQEQEVVGSAEVLLSSESEQTKLDPPPARWSVESRSPAQPLTVYFAEDIAEWGPRGETPVRVTSEAAVIEFADHTGELNPLYLDAEFAKASQFGTRISPPMLTFCLGFAAFLRELLAVPMPTAGFAGHLGDSWNFYRPVRFGDALRLVHQPLSCRRTRSRPEMAVVRFGLQLIDADDVVVQDGEVDMMIPARPGDARREIALSE